MCFAPQRRALFRHFFDIATSKSGPRMVCFVHFDLKMCFAPQRRALFRHRNNRTESKDERAGNTWRDGVIGEGRKGRSRRPCASDVSRVRSPREHRRHIPLYTCPFCEAAVSSIVRSGQVDHRRHCGNRFQVKDGCVVAKKMVYQCPFCDGKVSSNVMSGQINNRSVCGSQFYVKKGKVSDATRKHMHTCPRCQAAVWSATASGRIRVQHNTPAGRPCTQKSWQSEKTKEA